MSFFNKLAVILCSAVVLTFTLTSFAQSDEVVAVVGSKQITKKNSTKNTKRLFQKPSTHQAKIYS